MWLERKVPVPDRLTESEKSSATRHFDLLADIIESHWSPSTLRLPSPRDGKVMVEIDLGTLGTLVVLALTAEEARGA